MSSQDGTARRVKPGHEHLVADLAALPESDRRAVVDAANEQAHRRAHAVASKKTLEGIIGVVHLGGDAVEDCRRAWDP
ncbi:hypothetical protein BH11MYX2_BH11MYX2_22370 [soil metagenome]